MDRAARDVSEVLAADGPRHRLTPGGFIFIRQQVCAYPHLWVLRENAIRPILTSTAGLACCPAAGTPAKRLKPPQPKSQTTNHFIPFRS